MKKVIALLIACLSSTLLLANHWIPESAAYSDNMALYSVIQINGEEQYSDQLEVGVFCGDECRGSAIVSEFWLTHRYLAIVTVYGESGHQLTFKLYDHCRGEELELASPAAITFNDDGYGTPVDPYILNFTGQMPTAFHFATDGNWSEASNWCGNALPSAGDEVIIDANCTMDMNVEVSALTVSDGQSLTLQSGKTLTVSGTLTNTAVSGLVIKDGAQLIHTSGNVSATMEKDILAHNNIGWYTIASPMDEMSIDGSDFLTPEYDLYRYNENPIDNQGLEWENYKAVHPDFITFENGRGYLYANSNTFSPMFSGTLNHSTVNYLLSYTESQNELKGFNLIGNPFPHVIYKGTGGAIDNAKLASGYYTLTNEGAWHVHTFEDAILPGQGILVKTTEASDLAIAKSNVAASSESNGAKAVTSRMEIVVSGNEEEDRCFAYFSEGIDLNKMENLSETAPSLFIRDNGHNYAIVHLNNQRESIDLMFKNNQSGLFTLKVNTNGLSMTYLHLIDHITGANVDLLQQPTYTFQATGQEYAARFMLAFKNNTGIEENAQETFCYVKDGMLRFSTNPENAEIALMDALGRTVKSMVMKGNAIALSDLQSGIYIVRMVNGNESMTQKFVWLP